MKRNNRILNTYVMPIYEQSESYLIVSSVDEMGKINITYNKEDKPQKKRIYDNEILKDTLIIGKYISENDLRENIIECDMFEALKNGDAIFENKNYIDYLKFNYIFSKNKANGDEIVDKLVTKILNWTDKYGHLFSLYPSQKKTFDLNESLEDENMSLVEKDCLYIDNFIYNSSRSEIKKNLKHAEFLINSLDWEYDTIEFKKISEFCLDIWKTYYKYFNNSFFSYDECALKVSLINNNGKLELNQQGKDLFEHIRFLLFLTLLNDGGFSICQECGAIISGNKKKKYCNNTCVQRARRKKLRR